MTLPGLRILPRVATDRHLVALFDELPTATIGDNMHRMAGASELRPYHRGARLAGVALTVRVRPGDNLMIHKALTLVEPGDVVVVDGGGLTDRALVGEIMKCVAQRRGAAGFVIDGAIRDVAAFAGDTFGCFARGVSHKGPYKEGPGEINVPVSIAGMVVRPGDIVIGDDDGVLAIDPADAAQVAEATRAHVAREVKTLAHIAAGTYDTGWIDKLLAAKGLGKGGG